MHWKILLAVIGLLPAGIAFGQAAELAGRVTNGQTGAPIDGARLVVVGTVVEAYTREDGTFAVSGLPPGAYEVRISRAGYAPVVRPLEVRSEQASLSVELQPGLDPQSASAGRIVYAREIRAGRYGDITGVLADVAGVSAVGAYSDEPGARGGAWSESELLWNGFRMSDPLTRHPYSRLGLNAVERVSVKHAAFDVEYGDVRSSVMEVTTRKVGDDYLGYAEVQYRPPGRKHFGPMMFGFDSPVVEPYVDREAGAFSGNRFFPGWEAMASGQLREGDPHYGEPEELYALWLWRHRSPDAIAELKQLEEQGLVQFAPGLYPLDLSGAA